MRREPVEALRDGGSEELDLLVLSRHRIEDVASRCVGVGKRASDLGPYVAVLDPGVVMDCCRQVHPPPAQCGPGRGVGQRRDRHGQVEVTQVSPYPVVYDVDSAEI